MLARSRRADAISIAGIDLSQPAMPTNPSSRSAWTTVSTESQLTSRLTSEPRIPSWPIEMPSDTVIVPNSRATPPASRMPWRTSSASDRNVMLQGVISFQELAMPICGLAQSSSVNPIARSIARAAAFDLPSVTSRERGLMSTGCSAVMGPRVAMLPAPSQVVPVPGSAACHGSRASPRAGEPGASAGRSTRR